MHNVASDNHDSVVSVIYMAAGDTEGLATLQHAYIFRIVVCTSTLLIEFEEYVSLYLDLTEFFWLYSVGADSEGMKSTICGWTTAFGQLLPLHCVFITDLRYCDL